MVERIDAEVRVIDATFIAALVFGLRAQGFRVSPPDAWVCLALARSKAAWKRPEIAAVLSAALVRRPTEAAIFDEEFGRLFDGQLPTSTRIPTPVLEQAALSNETSPEPRPEPRLRRFVRRGHELAGQAGQRLSDLWSQRVRAILGRIRHVLIIGAAIASALAGVYLVQNLLRYLPLYIPKPGPPGVLVPSENELLIAIDAATAAVSLTGFGLLVWRAVALSGGRVLPKEEVTPPRPPPMLRPDGTVFRIGSLGGTPPAFLPPAIGAQIAEFIGYRQGEPDTRRIDAKRTIAAHMRGSDPAILIPERRRELPAILLLVDRNAEGRHWHTLADEFHSVLQVRGIETERIDYPGNFFSNRAGRRTPRPEALAVEGAVAGPGWTVTVAFGEADQLGRGDIDLFRTVAENGPLVFFDLRERALWDGRHAALKAAGVVLAEATATELRDALARIFAPDRVSSSEPPLFASRGLENVQPEEAAISALGEQGRLWASDCALVEPMSFALAEALRRRYPKLASPQPSLAFSRLAALPGAWTGPDGLRFGPPLRRRLLAIFAQRCADDRAKTMTTIRAAFDAADPVGFSATTIHRYAKSQADIFGEDIDTAVETIFEVEADEVLDPAPIRDFLDRLWVYGAPKGKLEPILLPSEPRTAAMRLRLFPVSGGEVDYEPDRRQVRMRRQHRDERVGYAFAATEIVPARWSLGLPSVRARVPEFLLSGNIHSGLTSLIGSFLTGGRHLIIAKGGLSGQERLWIFDTLLGEATPIGMPVELGGVATIVTARAASVAVIGTSASEWSLLRLNPHAPVGLEPLRAQVLPHPTAAFDRTPDISDRPPLAVINANGKFLFVSRPGEGRLLRCPLEDLEANPATWEFSRAITALAIIDEKIFVGLSGGDILRAAVETSATPERVASYSSGGNPSAIALVRFADDTQARTGNGTPKTREILVLGLEDGTLAVHDAGREASILRFGKPVRRVVAYDDKRAASVRRMESGEPEEAGLSVAVLGQGGLFDIVGVPLPSAAGDPAPFTAMSLLDRRIGTDPRKRVLAIAAHSSLVAVTVAGDVDSPSRIEVRPLDYRLPSLEPISEEPRGGSEQLEAPSSAQTAPTSFRRNRQRIGE
jgi:hypothetical protein